MANINIPNWTIPSEYKITHACGHTETVNLVGKPAGRDRQIRRLSSIVSTFRGSRSMLDAFMKRSNKWKRLSPEEVAFYRAKEEGLYGTS